MYSIQMHQVSDYLYIGGYYTLNLPEQLEKAGIKKVVSVIKEGTLDKLVNLKSKDDMDFLHIDVNDMPDEDLLSYFDSTYHFIRQGIEAKTSVYVHWPNTGFFKQLKLYETMKCRVNEQSAEYKAFKIRLLTKKGTAPSCKFYYVTHGPNRAGHRLDSPEMKKLMSGEPAHQHGDTFKCKKCRRLIFSESSVINHSTGSNMNAYEDEYSPSQVNEICTKDPYRILPVQWMHQSLTEQCGKLYCPNCSSLVGKFDWKGQECICGSWIIPGIHIHAKTVDLCRQKA